MLPATTDKSWWLLLNQKVYPGQPSAAILFLEETLEHESH
jgi:hypothetical protein